MSELWFPPSSRGFRSMNIMAPRMDDAIQENKSGGDASNKKCTSPSYYVLPTSLYGTCDRETESALIRDLKTCCWEQQGFELSTQERTGQTARRLLTLRLRMRCANHTKKRGSCPFRFTVFWNVTQEYWYFCPPSTENQMKSFSHACTCVPHWVNSTTTTAMGPPPSPCVSSPDKPIDNAAPFSPTCSIASVAREYLENEKTQSEIQKKNDTAMAETKSLVQLLAESGTDLSHAFSSEGHYHAMSKRPPADAASFSLLAAKQSSFLSAHVSPEQLEKQSRSDPGCTASPKCEEKKTTPFIHETKSLVQLLAENGTDLSPSSSSERGILPPVDAASFSLMAARHGSLMSASVSQEQQPRSASPMLCQEKKMAPRSESSRVTHASVPILASQNQNGDDPFLLTNAPIEISRPMPKLSQNAVPLAAATSGELNSSCTADDMPLSLSLQQDEDASLSMSQWLPVSNFQGSYWENDRLPSASLQEAAHAVLFSLGGGEYIDGKSAVADDEVMNESTCDRQRDTCADGIYDSYMYPSSSLLDVFSAPSASAQLQEHGIVNSQERYAGVASSLEPLEQANVFEDTCYQCSSSASVASARPYTSTTNNSMASIRGNPDLVDWDWDLPADWDLPNYSAPQA